MASGQASRGTMMQATSAALRVPTTESGAFFDGVDLQALARRLPTPFHVYSATAIRERIAALTAAVAGLDALICYAVKANSNTAILQLMAEAGLGADIVSAGELRRSLRAGIPAERIVFSGVGKTAAEIDEALATGILRFNVESRDELETLQRVAHERGTIAAAAVRINPDVDAGTHAKISTGKAENKFGVSLHEARAWFADSTRFPNARLDGLHVHLEVARLIDDGGSAAAHHALENEAIAQHLARLERLRHCRPARRCLLDGFDVTGQWRKVRRVALQVRRGLQVHGRWDTLGGMRGIEEGCRHGLRPIPLFQRLRSRHAAPAARVSDTTARCQPRPTENRSPA